MKDSYSLIFKAQCWHQLHWTESGKHSGSNFRIVGSRWSFISVLGSSSTKYLTTCLSPIRILQHQVYIFTYSKYRESTIHLQKQWNHITKKTLAKITKKFSALLHCTSMSKCKYLRTLEERSHPVFFCLPFVLNAQIWQVNDLYCQNTHFWTIIERTEGIVIFSLPIFGAEKPTVRQKYFLMKNKVAYRIITIVLGKSNLMIPWRSMLDCPVFEV